MWVCFLMDCFNLLGIDWLCFIREEIFKILLFIKEKNFQYDMFGLIEMFSG